ncbi:zinc-binding alcohol dehydrogenase family protein [Bacillus solitudinis]|uniref:zinc-binding alcohol dehydrogenase family protein n=1 Tax=Bacillus solitudinis TaxID=2014074 RepID=UPI000C2405A2|nr:zinc-binding alcohol dehydrogenase family protein [Bacillus solitudinis]
MKVITCEEPKQFKQMEEEIPEVGKGEILLKVKRIGICGTDIHAYNGVQPFFTYPRILGHELAGEVVKVGAAVDGFSSGDLATVIPYMECGTCIACRSGKTNCCTNMKVLGVHLDGGMREYLLVPSDHTLKVNQISLDEASMVEPLSIGAHAVKRSKIQKGETVLVIGAGPIGLGVMRFAKLAGAKVIAMDLNEDRLQFCKEWADVDGTVNASNNIVEEVSKLTNGDFPTTVFDATGNKASMTNAFQLVSHGGQLVYVGLVKDEISFNDPEFHKREMSLLGSRNATKEDFSYVINCIENKQVNVDALITNRSTLANLIDDFESFFAPENKVIKAVVEL